MTPLDELPLRCQTPPLWAITALTKPLALLNDHFHLEKKAATNALDMMSRWQGEVVPIKWFNVMSAIAKDETDHMKLIAKIIAKRNGTCTKVHSNGYASALRHFVRKGTASVELMDRLLISALIELRSCERFHLLATTTTDPELQKLYTGLWGSEKGHYLQFIESAAWVMTPKVAQERWEIMLNLEAQVIQSQPPGPRIHSWI